MPEYTLREYRKGDEHSLLELSTRVLGADHPDFFPQSLDEWNWSALQNPAGLRLWVAVHEDQIVAQFAGRPFRMLIHGEERIFAHFTEGLCLPDHQLGLDPLGLLVALADAYFGAYGGIEKDWAHFGYPMEEAARVGDRHLNYEIVRTQLILSKELEAGPTELPLGVERIERFDHQARWLYERCCGSWGVSAIRDDAFYNWRFIDHPRHRYRCFGVRDSEGILRGVAVYRHADWIFENVGFAVEWLVPPEEPEVGALLGEAIEAQARADGALRTGTLIPEWSPWFRTFQDWGWLVHPSDFSLRVRKFHPKFPPEALRDIWWHQLAETELV